MAISAVISDNPDSNALRLTRSLGTITPLPKAGDQPISVKPIAIDRRLFATRADYDRELLRTVAAESPDLVVLAGYMRLVDAEFIKTFARRIINIHPSLLPAFRGLHAQEQAIKAGVKTAGCTVHFVDLEVDAGPIIAQAEVPVLPGDTTDSLSERILEAEHELLPAVVKLFARGAVRIETDRETSPDGQVVIKETVRIDP